MPLQWQASNANLLQHSVIFNSKWVTVLFLQALDTFLAMSSMFGYTATLVLIPTLSLLAYLLPWKIPAWCIGLFVTSAQAAAAELASAAQTTSSAATAVQQQRFSVEAKMQLCGCCLGCWVLNSFRTFATMATCMCSLEPTGASQVLTLQQQ